MAVGRIGSISLDCVDPEQLARFWADLTGGEVAFTSPDFVAVRSGALWLTAVRVPDYQAPTWPSGSVPAQIHLDVQVSDLDLAEQQACALGARPAPEQPAPERWRVLLDPAGHPFCLSSQLPD